MPFTTEELKNKLKELAGSWPSVVAMGSFFLYVMGYLSIRFHLTALGLGTDLAVLDERYIFAGAKFIIYLLASLPIIAMPVLVVTGVYFGIRKIYRLATAKARKSEPSAGVTRQARSPNSIALLGIVISVILIQVVMRKCFLFSNLLLATELPSPLGLKQLLLDDDDLYRSLFFSGLVAGTILVGGLLFVAQKRATATSGSKFLIWVLSFLVVLQFLFLPVNYGIFIMDKVVPKVSDLGNQTALKEGQEAWLVWEGTHGVTYLVRSTASPAAGQPAQNVRSLVTLPRSELKRTEIFRYDQIIKLLFLH
jgi:hypothetical protein